MTTKTYPKIETVLYRFCEEDLCVDSRNVGESGRRFADLVEEALDELFPEAEVRVIRVERLSGAPDAIEIDEDADHELVDVVRELVGRIAVDRINEWFVEAGQ